MSCHSFGSYFCLKCQKKILQSDLVCPVCERPSIGGVTHPACRKNYLLDGLWFLGTYENPLKTLIQNLKYKFISDLGESLVEIMINYWAHFTPYFFDEVKKNPESWIVTSVPLHPKRQNWRGFNQSQLLGKIISKKLGLKNIDLLIRIKNTKPQAKLSSKDRKSNIKNAFVLAKNFSQNQNILLIDDVWTTGSTLKECCLVLKKGGAKKVWAITLAR